MRKSFRKRVSVFIAVFLSFTAVFGYFGLTPVVVHAANELYVSTYGAIPNDANDDGPAIRAAVDSAIAYGSATNINFSSGIYRIGPPPSKWEYNTSGNLEGWSMANQVSGSVSGGILTLTPSGTDPYINSPDNLHMIGANFQCVFMSIKNNTTATQAKLQWITQDDRTWDSTKSVTITISASDASYKLYSFKLVTNSMWTDKVIRQIRIHPEEGVSSGTVNVDYIKAGEFMQPKYAFDTAGNMQGWTVGNQCSAEVSGGSMNITISGANPFLYSQTQNIPDSSTITIRMKNNTSATTASLYYITSYDGTYNESKCVHFTISANDASYQTYLINMNQTEFKKVTQLRFDPTEGVSSGTVNVDYFWVGDKNPDVNIYAIACNSAVGLTFNGVISGNAPQTTLLVTDPFTGTISVIKSSNTTFKGLIVDYETPPFTQGTITAVNQANGTFDYSPSSGYSAILDDQRFINYANSFYGAYGCARNNSNPFLMKTTGGDIMRWDSFTKINSTTWRFNVCSWRIAALAPPELEVNDKFIITTRGLRNRAFCVFQDTGLAFDTVNIYASPEAAIISWFNYGTFSINNVKVMRKPSSDRWASTNADGLHVQSSKYGVNLTNSIFEGQVDDGLNFYTIPVYIKEVVSSTKIKVYKGSGGFCPKAGDQIKVSNIRAGQVVGTATVSSVEAVGSYNMEDICYLNLSNAISGMTAGDDYSTADYVFNMTYANPNFNVSGNTFRQNRGSGCVIKANGTIQNNTFTDVARYGVIAESCYDGIEGPDTTSLLIQNNTFTNCNFFRPSNTNSARNSVIEVAGLKRGNVLADTKLAQNITIKDNTINHVNSRNAVYIGSASNVTIENNTVTAYSGDYAFDGNITGVRLEKSDNVNIPSLTYTDPRSVLEVLYAYGDVTNARANYNRLKFTIGGTSIYGPIANSNIASGMPAVQSSTYPGAVAGRACDGNNDGNWYNNSVSSTNSDAQAWWYVDMQTVQNISQIIVNNRTDACMERLADFWVYIKDGSGITIWANHQTSIPNPSVTINTGGVNGRYVEVRLSGTNYLSLAEVEVIRGP